MPTTALTLWLRDAFAMEQGLIPVLQDHAGDAQHHAELHARLTSHIEQTRGHAELIRSSLARLGDDPAILKSAMSKTLGYLHSLAGAGADDQVIKNVQMEIAIAYYQIACYRTIAEAARTAGDEGTARMCDGIIREEEDEARFLMSHLPHLIHEYVTQAAGHT